MERIRFLEIIEFFPIGITISDNAGNLIESNKEGVRILGLKEEEHSGWRVNDPKWHIIRKDNSIMPPEEYPAFRALKEKIRVENVEVGLVKADGVTWLNVTAAPLPGEGGIIAAYIDVSRNVGYEKELERLISDRTKFFNIIAHDLRNPFNTIIGLLDLLLDDLSKYPLEKIEKLLQVIRSTSRQTFELLENLLNWSRAQSGTLDFKPENLDITLLVTETLNLLKQQAKKKNIHLCFNFDKHCEAFADKNMISTVLRNLITNAIKYSYPDSEISTTVKDTNLNVEIIIQDYGVGISEEKLKSLFGESRVSSAPGTAQETGSGLGLIITREFIERHNGEISVRSEPGKGSEFTVRIPKNF